MREGRQEFILAPVGLAQAVLHALSLEDLQLQAAIGLRQLCVGLAQRFIELVDLAGLFRLQRLVCFGKVGIVQRARGAEPCPALSTATTGEADSAARCMG